MKIANLKIGVRVGCGFGMVILLLMIVVAISMVRMHAMERRVDNILEDLFRQVTLANELKYNVSIIHQGVRNALIDGGTTGVQKEREAIASIRAKNNELLKQLEATVATERARDLLSDIVKANSKDIVSQNEVMKLVDDFKIAESRRFLLTTAAATGAEYVKGLSELSELQSSNMKEESKLGKAEFAGARNMLLVATAIAIGLALFVASSIVLSVTRPLNDAIGVAQCVASGDLTTVVEVKSSDEMGSLMQAFKEMHDSLARIVGEVRSGTDTIATASSQIASGNQELSSRTERQACSLEETASTMEELTSTVKQNADNARQANQMVLSTAEIAGKGGEVVTQVVATMSKITESSRKIGDIIGVIDGIAFQTNILALNAAVEAARAGEQGRGFAVVAAEVRNLAQRSAAAAKEIKTLIGDSVEKVEAGAKLVDQAGATMDEVVASVRRVTDIIGEMASSIEEQTTGIEQINLAIMQMDDMTQQNAALVEEAAAASGAMQDQAGNLAQAVSVFKLNQTAGSAIALVAGNAPAAHGNPKITATTGRSHAFHGAGAGSIPDAARVNRIANAKSSLGEEWEQY